MLFQGAVLKQENTNYSIESYYKRKLLYKSVTLKPQNYIYKSAALKDETVNFVLDSSGKLFHNDHKTAPR